MSITKWDFQKKENSLISNMAKKLSKSVFVVKFLYDRGIKTEKEILDFFYENVIFSDPTEIKDMEKAKNRILKSICNFERICVYGDYDADGVTATALLYSYLESQGANVFYYIPDRHSEGYGLNKDSIKRLKEQGVNLIITVDNGISSIEEVSFAKELAIDIVVTDHHSQHGDALPEACAVVNPHRKDCLSNFKELAGVGVAFKLICALNGKPEQYLELLQQYADLIVIGTIADLVPLVGENRILVKKGIQLLDSVNRVGLKALTSNLKLSIKNINSTDIAFLVAPKINAVGRLGSAERAVQLLLSQEPDEADSLALEVIEKNELRKTLESEIFDLVESSLTKHNHKIMNRIIVASGENFNIGVIGIVASKITRKYGKPCIIISVNGEQAIASGRSIEGFSLYDAIYENRQYFSKFGGHPMAVGFSMPSKYINDFEKSINDYATQICKIMPSPAINVDYEITPSEICYDLLSEIKSLEPFGTLNPKPIFLLKHVSLFRVLPIGYGKHLKIVFKKNDIYLYTVKFGISEKEFPYTNGDILDVLFTLQESDYTESGISIILEDIHLSNLDYDSLLKQKAIYECLKRGENVTGINISDIIPERQDFIKIYRYLQNESNLCSSIDVIASYFNESINMLKILIIFDIMNELGIINLAWFADLYNIKLLSVKNKVDIQNSNLLKNLKMLLH